VFNCPKPVVSAVGHEIDTTLVDLVSDVRAPTPSAAAELAVPERAQLAQAVAVQRDRAARWLQARVAEHRRHLAGFIAHGVLRNPDRLLADRRVTVDRLRERSEAGFRWVIERRRRTLADLTSRLRGLDPTAVLARGFALVTDAAAHPVTANGVAAGQELTVEWADGAWRVGALTPLAVRDSKTGDGEAEA
jgi:exodeoxyribonuclease VII large subunit